MKSDTPLDYAVFQLSPKRSRCELFVSSNGNTEKLASGLFKPFITHLKVAEEQVAKSAQLIKLEIERRKNAGLWFTKGTLERFVRFVTTPEILELVNKSDAEMSQLESARRIYSQGSEDQHSVAGGGGSGVAAAADATKKELLRAIDVRLVAVQQDLTRAYARAAAAGFNSDTVPELQMFADRFGAQRLNEACSKFISLCERRWDLINQWKPGAEDRAIRSSYGSDMSIDEDPSTPDSGTQHPNHSIGRAAVVIQTQQQQENPNQSQPSTMQDPRLSFPSRLSSKESNVESDDACKQNQAIVDEYKKQDGSDSATSSADQVEPIQASQPARRLSVQDRVKLFENKQKESSGSAGKPVVGKSVELRRLSSDVSSAPTAVEKAVLRRWSGASDMSIDLSGEKKDIESPLCTPSSSSVSQLKFEESKEITSFIKPESRNFPGKVDDKGSKDQAGSQQLSGEEEVVGPRKLTVSSVKQEEASESEKSNSSSDAVESDIWKDQTHGKTQSRTFFNKAGINSAKDQTNSVAPPDGKAQTKLKGFDDGEELSQAVGQVAFEVQFARQKDKGAPQSQFGMTACKARGIKSAIDLHQSGQGEFSDQKEDAKLRDQLSAQTHFKAPQKPVGDSAPSECASGSRIQESFTAQYKGIEGNSSSLQPRFQSILETKEVQKKNLAFGELSGSSAVKFEDSGAQRMKYEKQVTATEQSKKAQGRRDDSGPVYGKNQTAIPSKIVTENQEGFGSFSTPPADHVRVRQSKANQERNDELKMKASELEKLFAEHKLRVPGDQSNSTRRSRPVDRQSELSASLSFKKSPADGASSNFPDDNPLTRPAGSSKSSSKFNEFSFTKMVDGQNYSDALNKNFAELSFSEGSRGKFYERYMQKREAKLREEWSSKGAEKEANLKAMQDTLEQSRAEMKAKFSGSTNKQDSISSSQRRAERLRSYNARSLTRREQQQLDFGQINDGEDVSDFPEQNYSEDGSLNETSFVDSLSRIAQTKKLLPTKSSSSSTPRTTVAPVPRSATRASNISAGRRKVNSENPLAQSVPNFSELRKENTKPYSAANRTTRQQTRNYSRSKSSSEEVLFVREEKSRQTQSLRKSSANPIESRDLPPLNFDDDSFTAIKGTEQIPYDRYTKTKGSKPRGTGVDSGISTSVGLQKNTRASEATNDEIEYNDLAFSLEDPVELVKDEEEDEYETVANVRHSNLENGEPELCQEIEKMDFGLENGVLRPFPQVDSSFVAELPASVPPRFNPNDSMQDSPGESPVSWNSGTHHPFSYSHEMSDIDAPVDSPVGSPASWNSHSLGQTETDAARMRKKWGTAQKPMLVVNASNNQSRKDMTKGFKRLLKFGRKSRGTESLVDWISATTSEGDDDTEDGRDPTFRSSEDLRKSRMGSLQGHPLDDSFNESEFYGEQVNSLRSSIPAPPANFRLREDHLSGSSMKAPRSFFSLSSFRSKASDSKPR